MGGLLAALFSAYIAGFFTLAALAYRHPSPADEFRVHTSDGIELFAPGGRAYTRNWARIFVCIAIVAAICALAFALGASR